MGRKKILEDGTTLFARIEGRQHEALRFFAFKDRTSLAEVTRAALDLYIESRSDELLPQDKERERGTHE